MTQTPPGQPMTMQQGLQILASLRDQTRDATEDHRQFVNFCLNNIGWSRGQILQDLWVAYETKSRRGGYFVEFGALDGLIHSNTYGLETHLGWNGIVAEPSRFCRPAIFNNRACSVDTRCVWTTTGETLLFNQTQRLGLSTIDRFSSGDLHAHLRESGTRYEVETVSLTDLLAHWRAPRRIDYLSIDTEGSELDILQAFDWDSYDIRLLTVEHCWTEKRALLRDFLANKGYRYKFEQLSSADDWYVKTY